MSQPRIVSVITSPHALGQDLYNDTKGDTGITETWNKSNTMCKRARDKGKYLVI